MRRRLCNTAQRQRLACMLGVSRHVYTPSHPLLASPSPAASKDDAVGKLKYDASKAGLAKVNKKHVQKVIEDASKGSAFYENEKRQEAKRQAKHAALSAKVEAYEALSATERNVYIQTAEEEIKRLEERRAFDRVFIHVDMDMFYAAVEERLNPELKTRPFAVGSFAMLSTSNYIARQFGVRSGMPGFIAKKLCPDLWIVKPNMDRYAAEAEVVRRLGRKYDAGFVTVGLDELTLEVTAYLQKHPALTPEDVCAQFRREVAEKTGLTCSGGISHTAAFAKLASNVNKPNGQHRILLTTQKEVLDYVKDLPVRDMPGIGLAQETTLSSVLHIRKCAQFLKKKGLICYLFPEKTRQFYLSIGLGLVRTHVDRVLAERRRQLLETSATVPSAEKSRAGLLPLRRSSFHTMQKSASKESTFSKPLPSVEALYQRLRQLTVDVHEVLLRQGACASSISVYHKTRAFEVHSSTISLSRPTNNYAHILAHVKQLAEPMASEFKSYRLVGVRLSRLTPMQTKRPAVAAAAGSKARVKQAALQAKEKAKPRKAVAVLKGSGRSAQTVKITYV